jgi:hypothetical protein
VIRLGQRRIGVNRRAFLRGAAGVAVGLPFLESLPERSAWAVGQTPVFSLFICAVDGVVPEKFFPDEVGPLTVEGLAASGKATSNLSAHAENLLFVRGINWPSTPIAEPHAEALCIAFTGIKVATTGNMARAGGPSADWVIADKVQPGTPPLTMYAGNLKNGYITNRLSFNAASALTPAVDNPFTLYQQLIGIVPPDGTMTPDGEEARRLLFESRNSVHDLVRDELKALMSETRLGAEDRRRLQQHFDAIRDMEISIDGMGTEAQQRCSWGGLELDKIQAFETFKYDSHGMVEDMVRLHMSLIALAFACNFNRTATLQWGDGTDHTVYDVPSNADRDWPFNFICHRAQSDATVGNDELAALAHAEIDVVRMQTLAAGLEHFKARGLENNAFVLWTNGFADGPAHSYKNVPHILWGNGGGRLKQGEYVDAGNVNNGPLLNTLINAAIQDTGETLEEFGAGPSGQLDAVLA